MAISILLADDSPTIAKILTLSLASEGYTIRTVDTAARAIEELQNNPAPRFFLVDATLPVQDGFALSRFVKNSPQLGITHVVLLANAFEPLDENACNEAGVDAVITKPFDPAQLRAQLRELQSKSPKLAISATAPKPRTQATAPAPEATTPTQDLSPNAQKLADFFNTQVEQKNAPAVAETKLSPNAEALATFFNAEVNKNSQPEQKPSAGKTPEETIDLGSVDMDWNTLSQWSSSSPNAEMFDTADSNFLFSEDYVNRVTRSFAGTSEEEQANRKKPVHAESMHASPPPASPKFSNEPPRHAQGANLSKEELERIVREEVRSACREVVEKVAWEVIPELAENLIRKELDKVLKSLEP